mgnify:CR=1 FL=1|jgi:hypothetical protein
MGLLSRPGQNPGRKNHRNGAKTQRFCHPRCEKVGGKLAKTGGDVDAGNYFPLSVFSVISTSSCFFSGLI